MTALVLSLVMAAAPCTRIAVTPFEPLATSPSAARALEEQVRGILATRPGVCVESRVVTIEKLSKYERKKLPPCADLACSAAQLAVLETDEIVSGIVTGVGAQTNVDLVRATASRTARTTASEPELAAAIGVLYQWDTNDKPAPTRWPSVVLGTAAVASLGVGIGLGVEARLHEQMLSMANTGCGGMGTEYRDCIDTQIKNGKTEATAANVLFGVAGTLLIGAVVLWVVELP